MTCPICGYRNPAGSKFGLECGSRFAARCQGGEFEHVRVVVHEYDGSGRIRRHDIYSLDQLDAARARFAGLRPDPLRIPANTATQTIDARSGTPRRGEWDALRALCAPSVAFDDRRRALLTTGDRDTLIASLQYWHTLGARPVPTLLATSGDTLALEHLLLTGANDAAAFEIDVLRLTEVDAEGRIVARDSDGDNSIAINELVGAVTSPERLLAAPHTCR